MVKFPLSGDLSCALRTHYADGEGAAVRLWQLDMTERFLHFYERASRPGTSMDERWRLWRKMGRFAPVPTTPDGMKRAREMFEAVWPRYGQSLDAIAAGGAAVREAAPGVLGDVMQLLACRGRTLPPVLVVFVGFFENNGFVERSGGLDVVGIPAELAETQRPLTMAREFTQLVHRWKARLSGRRERRVARAVVSEGLAMHAGAALVPGRTVEEYVMEPESGWWASCVQRREEILRGVRESLTAAVSDSLSRRTGDERSRGTGAPGGPADRQREARAAGWWVVEHWLRQGASLADIAGWDEDSLVQRADRAIGELLVSPLPTASP